MYERFVQGYSVKLADTHGIVYTPQEIVNFMCASVAEVLEREFEKSLSNKDVYIIDPCTGTGNFVVNLLRRMPGRDLKRMYKEQLFANEVMLLPYYIAALNIEHAYYDITEEYEPFEGLCFVDTLDLAEGSKSKFEFMTETNTRRVERQRKSPITVVIGNPPYNMNQQNENDNNKNRKYEHTDKRVADTYTKASTATNKGALFDPYVKFFRWATDRLQDREGVVCFLSTNSFVDQKAFDGMRSHLLREFTSIYHVDLHGNGRRNPQLSGTTHNVFGIQVGVGITVAVRNKDVQKAQLQYRRVSEYWRKEQKLSFLAECRSVSSGEWSSPIGEADNAWIVPEHADEFQNLIPVAIKSRMADCPGNENPIVTARDDIAYDFNGDLLATRIQQFVEEYNGEVDRYKRSKDKPAIDDCVSYERVKWSRDLKADLKRGKYADFDKGKIRTSLYRPFCKRKLFFDRSVNEEVYVIPHFFPTLSSEGEHHLICFTNHSQTPFNVEITNCIPNEAVGGRQGQCVPFFIYDEDGTNRRENITDWALEHFRKRYPGATKWDIFYYVYGVLHHPEYREKYAENLKRELPRIPLAKEFRKFAEAGRELARLHVEYESVEP